MKKRIRHAHVRKPQRHAHAIYLRRERIVCDIRSCTCFWRGSVLFGTPCLRICFSRFAERWTDTLYVRVLERDRLIDPLSANITCMCAPYVSRLTRESVCLAAIIRESRHQHTRARAGTRAVSNIIVLSSFQDIYVVSLKTTCLLCSRLNL